MIQGTARIVRVGAAALAAALVMSICTARERPEQLELSNPEPVLNLSSPRAAPVTLNTTSSRTLKFDAPRQRSFYTGYLLPGLEKQLSRVGVLYTSVLDRPDMGHYQNHDELAAISERMFERGASRALRSYLSELTGLETMVLNLAGRRGMLPDGTDPSRFNLGIGLSSALPRVELDYRIGDAGNIRLSLCADGAVDLNFGRYGRRAATRFYAGYDMRAGTADAGLKLSF